jgi:hypothetical protein
VKFNQVTWYSKLAALILFIALPFLGFWAGMIYERATNPRSSVSGQKTATKSSSTSKNNVNSRTNNKFVLINDQLNIVTVFQNGSWEYSGIVYAPNSCTSVEHDVLIRESFPEQVSIEIKTMSTQEVCAQVITPKSFSGKFQASSRADISVTLDGKRQ